MKLRYFASVLFAVLYARDVSGAPMSFDTIRDILFPRNPEVHRVRRMEDANGDAFAVLDTVGLVELYGYPAEEHKLTTTDGYNMVFFRIPGSPESPPADGKPIIFIQHGLMASSDSWVFVGPINDLGFFLADAGYDVWIGNVRGNTYCRSHKTLSTADKAFWNFSFHEIATIDVAMMIDYALEHTGQKSLYYIGHSMGTTISYILLSERPEYNAKMNLVISLAPSASWKYMPNLMHRLAAQYGGLIGNVMESMGIYDIAPQSKTNAIMTQTFCGNDSPMQALCVAGLFMSVGKPAKGFNATLLPHISKYVPAGASGKTVMHYQQCLKSGALKKYDYGSAKNLKLYGAKKPPPYELSKISAPVALIYGNTDELGLEKNVITVSKMLPNVATVEAVATPVFNHLDFVVSALAKDLVYKRVIELMSKYAK